MSDSSLPLLAVDLDGTLIRSDVGFESFWSAFSRHWTTPFIALFALFRGLPTLKTHLRDRADIDVSTLPYNPDIIAYIQQWRKNGGRTALVTASNAKIAEKIADHLQIFDENHGTSDHGINLKGRNKAAFLERHSGPSGYAYMGDAHADIPVWKKARKAITIHAPARLRAKAQKVCADTEHIYKPKRPSALYTLAKTMRIHQWLKNFLLFLPLLLAHKFDSETLMRAALGFVAFSLTASGIYVINDLLDLTADRAHPRKCARPVASGDFSIMRATLIIPILLAAGLACAWPLGNAFIAILIGYAAATILYSLSLKRLPIIDICALASFYTIRILAGGIATTITISIWLGMFSVFIFFSLGATKRLTELANTPDKTRHSTNRRDYSVTDLPAISSMALTAGYIAVLVMALYIDSSAVQALYGTPQMLWGICPILLFWVSRTVMLAHRGQIHDDLVVYIATDRVSYVCVLLVSGFALAAALI